MSLTADLPQRLSSRLHQPLPGWLAQRTMEPELSFGRYKGPPRPDAQPAAVAAVLYQQNDEWHLPLMLRPVSLAHHAGQISLPGGTIDPDETSEKAALRELEEELGISRDGVLLLGQLSPLYLFGTNFLIAPWVAAVRSSLQLRPNPAEVQEVLQMPLADLLNPASRGRRIQQRGSLQFEAPHFAWRQHLIWGATSMILAELVAVLSETAA
ncbi:MAG TPA: CoA pyrophosphatase [Pirellulales bacterium]|nr:CoA pyrophosphatase [Pirellulales bacterium]